MEADTQRTSGLAAKVMRLAHDDILIHLRFFDAALARLTMKESTNSGCMATDGSALFYDPVFVL